MCTRISSGFTSMNRLPKPGASRSSPHPAWKSISARLWQAQDARELDCCEHGQVRHGTRHVLEEGDGYPVRRGRDGNRWDAHRDDYGWWYHAAGEWGRVGARRSHWVYGWAAFSGEYLGGDSVGRSACLARCGTGKNIRRSGSRRRHGRISRCADFDVAGYARGKEEGCNRRSMRHDGKEG